MRVALGTRSLSVEGRPDESRAIATIRAALDLGVTLIDTSPSYHAADAPAGDNERLVAQAIAGHPAAAGVLVATKGGVLRDPDGGWRTDASPAALRRAAEGSLRRLGGDAIGLYQLHKPDPAVPYEDSLGAILGLVEDGLVLRAGVSNVEAAHALMAHEILGPALVSVQNQLSPVVRDSDEIVELCTRLGLRFLAWGPFGGAAHARVLLQHPVVVSIARARGLSPAVICLAWVLGRSDRVIPLVGATRPETIADALGARDVVLTPEETGALATI